MKYNKFYLSITFRILLLLISCILAVYFLNSDDKVMNTIIIALLIPFQTILLIRYVNKTNRDLAAFLTYLSVGDTSIVFNQANIEKTFKGLHHSFEELNQRYKDVRTSEIIQRQYLKFIIRELKTGILVFNESGDIEIINEAAKQFLNTSSISNIRNTENINTDISNIITSLEPGKISIVKIQIAERLVPVSISASDYKIRGTQVRLITFQNVSEELEISEIESWQKLIRVLTHEMMNSLTPITSLATGVKRYLTSESKRKQASEIDDEIIEDIYTNSDIIEERSIGLLDFITKFKSLTKLPKPKHKGFSLPGLINKVEHLFSEELKAKGIVLKKDVQPEKFNLISDEKLLEQVLINIIKNAIEGINEQEIKKIEIEALRTSSGQLDLRITDNGKGMSEEVLEQIFIPFFTTKEKGSGIGLSLSKQIVRLLGGKINIISELNKFTTVHITI